MINNLPEQTLHTDGYVAELEYEDNKVGVVIRFVVNGKRSDKFVPVKIFESSQTEENEAKQQRVLALASAACLFLNTGGTPFEIYEIVDRLSGLSPIVSNYSLVAILPPSDGHLVFWKKPDGTYLKCLVGPEGFTDHLEKLELEMSLSEEEKREAQDKDKSIDEFLRK